MCVCVCVYVCVCTIVCVYCVSCLHRVFEWVKRNFDLKVCWVLWDWKVLNPGGWWTDGGSNLKFKKKGLGIRNNIWKIALSTVTIFIYLEIPPRFLHILRVFLAVFGRSGLQLKYSLPTRLNLTSSIKKLKLSRICFEKKCRWLWRIKFPVVGDKYELRTVPR
jgi:hypothetical protein